MYCSQFSLLRSVGKLSLLFQSYDDTKSKVACIYTAFLWLGEVMLLLLKYLAKDIRPWPLCKVACNVAFLQ